MKGTENGTVTESTTTSIMINVIGKEAVEALSEALGGEVIYIPRRIKEGRDEIIKSEFRDMLGVGTTCMNIYKTLADRYKLSPRRIMAIVNH